MTPTSPLRVFEQAPAIQPGLFLSDANLVEKGAQAFQRGMELPLLQEKIKLEKLRNRVETDKLKLAEATLGQRMREEEESAQRRAQSEVVGLALQNEALIAAQNQNAKNRVLTPEQTTGLFQKLQANRRTFGPSKSPSASAENLPLAGEAPTPFTFTGEAARFNPGEGVSPGISKPVGNPLVYRPTVAGKDPVETVHLHDPNEVYGQALSDFERRMMAPGVVYTAGEAAELPQKWMEFEQSLNVERQPLQLRDDNGIPLVVDAEVMAGKPVRLLGAPRIDKVAAYAENEALKTQDVEYAKRIAGMNEAVAVGQLQSLEDLKRAALALKAAEESGNPAERSRIIGALPLTWQKLLAPKSAEAKEAARAVVQKNLRETLGAQFARVEGENMMDRAFDLLLGAEVNAELLEGLYRVAATVVRDTQAARNYFRANNNTLIGYNGPEGLLPEDDPSFVAFTSRMGRPGAKASSKTSTPAEVPLVDEYFKTPTPPRKTRG